MRKYHLTARPNKRAKNKVWYAWYVEDGKRVFRSTGCGRKADALQVVQQWEAEDKQRAVGTLTQLTASYFVPGECPYLQWRSLAPGTISEHKRNKELITDQFGERHPVTITAPEVERWLEREYAHRKSSWKRNVLSTFRIMLEELVRAGIIVQVPRFRVPPDDRKKADSFTGEEIQKLFPADLIDLALVWTKPKKREKDQDDKLGLLFGVMFLVQLHAGMRPGEIRALPAENVYAKFNGIHIAQQLNAAGKISRLKKATVEDKKERLVKIPASTMELLTEYMKSQEITEGLIFLKEGKPIRPEFLEDRFDVGVKNAKIKIGKRKIVPYSLRYTYRSRIEGFLKREQIKEAMGHSNEEMTMEYLEVHPDQFRAMEVDQARIEKTWEGYKEET